MKLNNIDRIDAQNILMIATALHNMGIIEIEDFSELMLNMEDIIEFSDDDHYLAQLLSMFHIDI